MSAKKRFSWAECLGIFCFGLAMLGGAPLGLVQLLHWLNLPIAAVWVAAFATFFMLAIAIGMRTTPDAQLHQKVSAGELETEVAMWAASSISMTALYAVICHELQLHYPAQFSGTGESAPTLGTWFLYALDNVSESVFFDIPNIYDLHWTEIWPARPLSRFITVCFRLSLDFLLVASLWKLLAARTPKPAPEPMTQPVSRLP